ncbi:GNAT superfamily N-acetyltransferase [Clostridium tetanomorphum]|uniref:GNAT family N-acetyltransferase n=1 Tax=Clostridium tetanomorphum TaxID=1553 RepID=A0A923E705_CLOTT|nr:GNAT family N-acetyltransferase [Clostridium tetanomorphum]KAJ50225.1 N-acetyltransferase GCN5 [Clostridium tetanomorphum DSM 665]MBC2396214.1 GNAT family N-acetyltransferase [Clostridium tetanomorphum]MBP1864364.1 GNAT superfamily N-acetyltransferase [Clostridium tetanomorphum]NRS83810.1 GNAT superfamily N-acetyltransferase [Clostridium tetanomorphum]NRZ97001.1 GNAT superfamily N-acetyltransferase [Clostridium tetanomorphum]
MELKVIKLSEEYLEECVDLFIDTFSRAPWNDEYDSRQQVKNFFINHMKNNYFLGYIGLIDKEVVALSVGMKKPWICGMEYYIDEFCIGDGFQGKGIGSLFLKDIEKLLYDEKVEGMILNTERDYPSCKFYEKNGFQVLGNLIVLGK